MQRPCPPGAEVRGRRLPAPYLSRAPPSPDSALPSQSGDARDFSLAPHPSLPVAAEKTTIDPERVYRLPDLIDIGESTNPDTRIEWEKARQAALAVGLARSEYLPTISAMALGGYHRTWFQVPAGSNSLTVNPNVSFTGAHQKVASCSPRGSWGPPTRFRTFASDRSPGGRRAQ